MKGIEIKAIMRAAPYFKVNELKWWAVSLSPAVQEFSVRWSRRRGAHKGPRHAVKQVTLHIFPINPHYQRACHTLFTQQTVCCSVPFRSFVFLPNSFTASRSALTHCINTSLALTFRFYYGLLIKVSSQDTFAEVRKYASSWPPPA